MVSELAVKVIRQFHSGIPSGSASHPSPHCSRLCAAKHNESNSGVAFSFFKYALIRPLDSLPQCAEGIKTAIQLVAWEPTMPLLYNLIASGIGRHSQSYTFTRASVAFSFAQ